jgi:hypothetical protein
VYTHGSGIRARRKRWLLAVAGSRTGHHLQGELHGAMTLLVIACRGPPGCSEQGYFTAVWLPLGRGFTGGDFCVWLFCAGLRLLCSVADSF